MPYHRSLASFLAPAAVGITLLSSTVAEAQISPGMTPGMGGPQQPAGEAKKEGVAEAAPKTPGLLPTTPALPPPKGRRKQWKLLEIDGYFRLRTDWFKNFNLGFIDRARNGTSLGGAPFPRALGCTADPIFDPPCENLSSANMRLRLEPTINLTEGTSIHIQADVLDNLVLGSTPIDQRYGTYVDPSVPPLGPFGDTQAPLQEGITSDRDTIVIKRAWAEVALPLGVLKAGRMPNHWGMGIYYNAGGYDPISGLYDYDADYGDTVDRVSFSTVIPGTNLRAMIATDWASTSPVSYQSNLDLGRNGHPWDLDDGDDRNSWIGVISRLDSPQEFTDIVDRGDVAFNYGVYFEYKTQAWAYDADSLAPGTEVQPFTRYVPRDLKIYSPDLWAKLGYGPWTIEGEFIAQLGSIDRLDDLGRSSGADIRKFGGTGRVSWRGMGGKLRLGLESGAASGDQWDNTPQGNTHVAFANLLGVCPTGTPCPADDTLSQLIFNREYKIDMILFRHLMGAVTNAGYVKPFMQYDLTQSIAVRAANITSFALRPIATPGNSTWYGTEFNADLSYRSNGLTVGIAYGVLFPFAALGHGSTTDDDVIPGYGTDPDTGESNIGSAKTAHTIQSRLILAF